MKRPLRNTVSMSFSTFAIERGGGASAGRGGSLKKRSVPSTSARLMSEDITSTYAMPRFWRTCSASIGPIGAADVHERVVDRVAERLGLVGRWCAPPCPTMRGLDQRAADGRDHQRHSM